MARNELRNVAASIHARLLRVARDQSKELQRLLVHYALERFLYRLPRTLAQAMRATFERRGSAVPGERLEALGPQFFEDPSKNKQ